MQIQNGGASGMTNFTENNFTTIEVHSSTNAPIKGKILTRRSVLIKIARCTG